MFLVGSTQQVCDQIVSWVEETGIDGINLIRTVEPEGLHAFCKLVVPELQNRGMFKTRYREGAMREKLFSNDSARVTATHPAAKV